MPRDPNHTDFNRTWLIRTSHQHHQSIKMSWSSVKRLKFYGGSKIACSIGKPSGPYNTAVMHSIGACMRSINYVWLTVSQMTKCINFYLQKSFLPSFKKAKIMTNR